MRSNFRARLRERGKIVPGSLREGHNIVTEAGLQALAHLLTWSTIAPDVALTDHRLRWISVGQGTQPEIEAVVALNDPLEVTAGVYLVPIDHASTVFSATTTLKIVKEFATTDLSFGGPVTIAEAGLFVDSAPGLALSASSPLNTPFAYKTYDEGLVKTAAFTLEIEWNFAF
jgi:hypothetical protein